MTGVNWRFIAAEGDESNVDYIVYYVPSSDEFIIWVEKPGTKVGTLNYEGFRFLPLNWAWAWAGPENGER